MDRLLDLLERDPGYRHFTLDGQLVVIDDYLEVRPGARERIAKLVREGRLLVGPWYVLPDEWLVSGEALIRNLRLGLARAAEFGGGMRLGYVPDQFGHVGQLPQIFSAFGFDAAVLWRGVGDDVDETLFSWESPDGTNLLTVYLPQGYGNASQLPLERELLAERLRDVVASLGNRSRIPTLLLMNGSDHLEPQPELPAALAGAVPDVEGASYEIGTLPGFVERARGELVGEPPRHRGELRSGLRAPLLEGCASSRAPQKRADFLNDRLLVSYLEPLAAWLQTLGGNSDPEILDLAWRTALQNHPHDSICGCSIDAVHDQMDVRFARVRQIGETHLQRVTADLASRVASPRGGGRSGSRIVVWNPGVSGPTPVEGEVEMDVTGRRGRTLALHARDGQGRRIPVHATIEEPRSIEATFRLDTRGGALVVGGFPSEFMGLQVCDLRLRRRGDRLQTDLFLGLEAPAGFDLSKAKAAFRKALAKEGVAGVDFRAIRLARVGLRFVDEQPGCGLRVYRVVRGRALGSGGEGELQAETTELGGAVIANAVWRVQVKGDGSIGCTHLPSGVVVHDALRLVSEGDRGDSYTFDPVPGAEIVDRLEQVRVRLGPASEAEVGVVVDARLHVPRELATNRAQRSRALTSLRVRLHLRLERGLDRVVVFADVENHARDQRLRLHVRAPFSGERLEVESAFEVAERPIAPEPDAFGSEQPAEFPVGASPQRRFATLHGAGTALTVANRGCAEVEAVREPDGSTSLALTVLRATGWLSRDDLALRPGPAGPALPTPGNQVPGPHRVELSWRLHAADDPMRTAEALRFACPALAFGGEAGRDAPLRDGDRLLVVDDPRVVVSAIEPRPGSAPMVRLYNGGREALRAILRWNGSGARSLQRVDLAGRPQESGFERGGGPTGTALFRPAELIALRPD
jgi:hypothetical protein